MLDRLKFFGSLYRAFLKVSIMSNIQYRASGVIWMIGSVLEPTIFLIVWSSVARSRGGEVQGFTASEFAAYYIILMFINHLTFSWIMQVFQYRIQFGGLSFELLRPIHPIHSDISDNVAYKIVQMTIMVPAVVILILLFEPKFNFELWSLALAIPVIFLAFLIRFLLEWCLALVAFWTTRIQAVNQTYFAIVMFFSGRVAPIVLMPAWVQTMAENLPFYYMLAFPVELLTGRMSPSEAAVNILLQLGWLLFAFVLISLVWKRAVRNFSAVGN
jgi:ABC-2 type transport system permease protein|tara:strand:+ start:1041 stop:1856 length:816 start_codon:yes stop_codon:yes gene_type:complete